MLKNINYWYISSFLISLLVALPILTVFASFFGITSDYYELLRNTFLIDYIKNSAAILVGVLLLTFILGVLSAYFVSFYNFPGVNFFKWALILSFAVPAYIYAYSLTAFFENFGTLFTLLKWFFGEGDYNKYIPKFDGMVGAVISMSFSLFGYVYVLTRASFYHQSHNLIEVSKNLGFSAKESFFKIILPSARPAIVAGLSLVAMECLADFGTVSFFNVSTFTTGIYNSWLSYDDLNTANQLSFILLLVILVLFFVENFSRGGAKYHQPSRGFKRIPKIDLQGKKTILPILFCSLLFFFSFIFPTSQMAYWTFKFPKYFQDINLWSLNLNTLILVVIASFVLVFFSFLINYGNRVSKSKFLNYLSFFSISGYAIPGIILAVAFISFFSWISDLLTLNFGFLSIKKIFIGSILGLVLAYFIRFYSLAFNGIKSNYLKINQSIDESSYLLGYSKLRTFRKIHLPYLKNSVFLISILIAIEIIKELPITLILRPFNFDTFATKAYAYASQDLLEAAALPSLFLIFWAGLLIFFTSKYILSEK
ncbi:iron ABC transporter permease [Pelagibacteraceae bacterium]|jgi:iron(III) transport system permease protein|nr:iron ABC transporter permease [Pelagibacteraceae bacterium]|tara:strand:- start:151 stop:1767 length:1617 start_codon:yes stop_codon:yes gene_type:complete